MGCCSSTARDPSDPPLPPVVQQEAHNPSSSNQSTAQPTTTTHVLSTTPPLRPHVWTSTTTRSVARTGLRPPISLQALSRERVAFFETRVSGRPEVWAVIRMACSMIRDGTSSTSEGTTAIEEARGILDAAGVYCPTGDLVDGVYDAYGALYRIPGWVFTDPPADMVAQGTDETDVEDNLEVEEVEEKGKGKMIEEEGLDSIDGEKEVKVPLRARLSDRGGQDVVLQAGKTESVRSVIRRIRDEANISGKVKLVYLGTVLKEGDTLSNQGWREGHVVNAFVFPASE